MSSAPATPNPAAILQLGLGFWGSKTLLSAIELGLFTALSQGPRSADDLRQELGLHARSVNDFLDALVALGLLLREDGRYANTPETAQFLDQSKPGYVGGILEMANTRLYPFWGKLTEALRTGQPQNEIAHGNGNAFEVLYSDPARLREFLRAMTGISIGSARAIAAKFPWAEHRTFADIGAAQGGCACEVARAHPHLRGIGFDLAPVQPIFEEYVAAQGLAGRVRFQVGDFWNDPLPEVEVLIMGHILHDWNLEEKKVLLAKAYAALPPGGALIVHEAMIDDERRRNAFGLLMSLNMLIETRGGFDYTGADCVGWMRAAGFRDCQITPLAGPDSMAVGWKR
ncbi:MAG TPA: methyltransferase [Terriglobales bacterium]|nr:methyltransferase [Terriglobales bacterium]